MEEKYPSFNGMNRPAVVKVIGTPLMPTLILTGVSLFSVMIANFYEMTSIALPIPIASFVYLFFLKIACEDNPNALAQIKWQVRAFFIKLFQGNKVICLSSDDDLRREKYNARRQFKKC
ncbi:conjugal transfer protein TraD [Bisgaard Taxon 10/6]|uniref:conjugal transfer protein TraD n=1 Tax=Exercitatus varius TaxID=67857 RepID=UPI00294B53FD|nr:conjugal transfer protein TraD [Exercitatus varius]MDG2957044.1 conjugal transfer protein TraD [Exercitatus varius]MDG2965268.1 conjugal transfer protein TraD [Exercitatus varius]